MGLCVGGIFVGFNDSVGCVSVGLYSSWSLLWLSFCIRK
jgi:hypothetical protein